jgi:ribosomal protein L24E
MGYHWEKWRAGATVDRKECTMAVRMGARLAVWWAVWWAVWKVNAMVDMKAVPRDLRWVPRSVGRSEDETVALRELTMAGRWVAR